MDNQTLNFFSVPQKLKEFDIECWKQREQKQIELKTLASEDFINFRGYHFVKEAFPETDF